MTATADALRLRKAEQELQQERERRRQAEMRIAGLTSAIRRFQAEAMKRKADEAERRANGHCDRP